MSKYPSGFLNSLPVWPEPLAPILTNLNLGRWPIDYHEFKTDSGHTIRRAKSSPIDHLFGEVELSRKDYEKLLAFRDTLKGRAFRLNWHGDNRQIIGAFGRGDGQSQITPIKLKSVIVPGQPALDTFQIYIAIRIADYV